MAKVTAPFKIKGTLSGINFYDVSGQNLAREKGKSGITKQQFANSEKFNHIREHGTEFGSCVLKSRVFRLLAKQFYDKAKEVSFAGRVNKLLFEILEEDTQNKIGERKLENGLQIPELNEILVNFEGNKTRPLKKVLNKKTSFDWKQNKINLPTINVEKDINWPEPEANRIHIQLAIANWNYIEDTFENQYSNEIILEKTDADAPLEFQLNKLQTKDLWIAFIFIGFSNKERRKTKPLHKKWNTATIIEIQNFNQKNKKNYDSMQNPVRVSHLSIPHSLLLPSIVIPS
ncbi:hypothetical protein [Flavobacterium sp.]|uniref:hypothetical protein n=1 Tax=Flavobacterium sp. TaxID=239 RepID=UPI0025B9A942|nr:hypothetical protein [Flavobacterium sp.]